MTGVLYNLPSDGDPAPYGTTDEATGERYILDGGGQRPQADGVADGQLAAEISDAARITAAGAGQPVLPDTGGPPLLPLLLTLGLLAYRLLR